MKHRILAGPVPLAVTLACACSLWSACGAEEPRVVPSVQTYEVGRGDLRISVQEKAEIQAARQVTVTSQVEGRATLIHLAPEGSLVEAGDELAQLDVSALEEKRSRQAIAVAKAEAALEQARKSREIMAEDLAASRSAAESKLEVARMERQKFLGRPRPAAADGDDAVIGTNAEMLARLRVLLRSDPRAGRHSDLEERVLELLGDADDHHRDMGEMANEILRKIDEIRLARSQLELNLDTYRHSQRLAAREFITRNELERDKLSYEAQLSKVNLAWSELDLLINYSLRQRRILLQQDVQNAELNLLSVIGNNESRRVREKVELKSREAELRLAEESLRNWERQVANGLLRAPGPGLVVHAKRGNRWSSEVVEEGIDVRKGQSLIHLPDLSSMIAELKVQEADIDDVSPGLPALVRADAYPELELPARVARVAALPDSGSRFNDSLKVFKTTVALEDTGGFDLRPGMNATVEIVIDVLRDVLTVPLPAVQRSGNVHYVWRAVAAGPVATPVQIGRKSLTHVEIRHGLGEGDLVLLVVPTGIDPPDFSDLPPRYPHNGADRPIEALDADLAHPSPGR